MKPDQKVFTTGQVARICNCAPRTVAQWIDGGELRGYRLPQSRDRRVTRAALLEFMTKTGMDVPDWLVPNGE